MAGKSRPGTRQTDGKILVWFGEIERKLAKLQYKCLPLLEVLPLNYFMVMHSYKSQAAFRGHHKHYTDDRLNMELDLQS
jgi:hypothetical protein